jgi:hypothetical protein
VTPPLTREQVASLTSRLKRLNDPADGEAVLSLVRLLHEVGRRDLPLGRVFEGHVDALQIVMRYGSAAQAERIAGIARAGGVLGVWNADRTGDPTRLEDGRLTGAKAFASGAGLLSHALVTIDEAGGRQLLIIDLEQHLPELDTGWWRVSGMQRSETHVARWRGVGVDDAMRIGEPGDYVREPWFSGGAIRFAAVQAGGIAAVVDRTRDHLVAQQRDGDPHQRARLADLYCAAQSAADAVARAARHWSPEDVPRTLAYVAAARAAVYSAGETVLTLAQAAVGVQAMFVDHPLSEVLTDLSTYLRQPAPDLQRDRTGEAVAAGLLRPYL